MKNHWFKRIQTCNIYFDSLWGDTIKEKFEGIYGELFDDKYGRTTRVETGFYFASLLEIKWQLSCCPSPEEWVNGKRKLISRLHEGHVTEIWYHPKLPDHQIRVWYEDGRQRLLCLIGFEPMLA